MIIMESGLKQRVCINVKFHLRRLATIILLNWIPKKFRKVLNCAMQVRPIFIQLFDSQAGVALSAHL